MPESTVLAQPDPPVDPHVVRRKVAWRILPLIFLLYIVAYLDRANVGFAALKMQDALHFSPTVFGDGSSIFFVGYLLLEIPGALLVEYWSAKKWFARILVTWGFCSMAMALVETPTQFYVARFLLGLAEAGFFPGVIVYFTHWFPREDRGRALAGLVLGLPVSLALGARVSGWLLEQNWLGMAGWQWVFLVEGFPAIVLGIAVLFLLTDRPRNARWLTPAERNWLEQKLAAERQQTSIACGVTLPQVLRKPTVWILALGILVANTGGYALVFWLPTAVKNLLIEMQGSARDADVLNWVSIIYAFGFVGVWASGQLSDRTGQSKWLCVAGQVGAGSFLAASLITGQPWGMVFFWLCLTGFFLYFWPPPFWVLPTQTLSAAAAAVSIGFINICANIGGIFGPSIWGRLKDSGFDDRACLLFGACCYIGGGILISLLRVPPKSIVGQDSDPDRTLKVN